MRQRNDTGTADAPPSVVPALGRWGLSPHADLVYRSLTLTGPATPGQLSGRLGVEAPRIGRALDELAGFGAARPSHRGRDGRWRAVDADLLVARTRRPRTPEPLNERCRRHLAAVSGLALERVPGGAVHRLMSRTSVRDRIADLAAAERHEHLAINTEEAISADAAAAASPLDRALVARGVRLRTLGLAPQDGSRDATLIRGIEHRHAPALPLKLLVFDRRSAIFPADPADFEAGAIEIDDAASVELLTQFFYRIWSTAVDPHRRAAPPIVLSHREKAIVALLAAGLTEEAAAGRLGISRRTVTYALTALMDRLGVDNRFQLALLLGAAQVVSLPSNPPPPGKES
jgi:DNA-binding CsgD family transcriptional regulator/sugar-specific transcriptional regulator TrmB